MIGTPSVASQFKRHYLQYIHFQHLTHPPQEFTRFIKKQFFEDGGVQII
jgi:hypothetical protein